MKILIIPSIFNFSFKERDSLCSQVSIVLVFDDQEFASFYQTFFIEYHGII